jgi:Legionella pneumophila major outer membrane protein precursor
MKIRSLAIALIIGTTLAGTPLVGQGSCGYSCNSCCDPCWDRCDWCGNFEVGAHALYWKPMTCAWAYGSLARPNEMLVKTIKPDYAWGFRLFGLYTRDCFFAQLTYTWLQTRDGTDRLDELNVNGFINLVNQLNRAAAKLDYDYQNVDLRLGQFIHRSPGCQFNLFGNVRWVEIEENRHLFGNNQLTGDLGAASITYKTEFSGVGLGVGTSGEYGLGCNFNAFGQLNFMAIIGDRQNPNNHIRTAARASTIDYKSNTCIIPAADLRFGFNYEWTCRCLTTVWEIGYETNYYWNVLERVSQDADGNVRDCIDLGFAGPYAGVRILF